MRTTSPRGTRIRRACGVAAGAFAVAALATSPASADSSIQNGMGSSLVKFNSSGEKVTVCDQLSDGRAAVAKFYRGDTGKWYKVWHYKGSGGCSTYNYSMAEDTLVKYQACLGKWSTKKITGSCSTTRTDLA